MNVNSVIKMDNNSVPTDKETRIKDNVNIIRLTKIDNFKGLLILNILKYIF